MGQIAYYITQVNALLALKANVADFDSHVANAGAHGITVFGSTVVTAANASQGRAALGLATVAASGSAADLSGELADARLSGNVPLKNAANTFTAVQTVGGLQSAGNVVAIGIDPSGTETRYLQFLNTAFNFEYFRISADASGNPFFHMGNTASFQIRSGSGAGTSRFSVDSNGNTAVGGTLTTSALAVSVPGTSHTTFQVVNLNNAAAAFTVTPPARIVFSGTNPSYDGLFGIDVRSGGSGGMIRGVHVEYVTNASALRVGINTSTPAYTLDVVGTARVTGTLYAGRTTISDSSFYTETYAAWGMRLSQSHNQYGYATVLLSNRTDTGNDTRSIWLDRYGSGGVSGGWTVSTSLAMYGTAYFINAQNLTWTDGGVGTFGQVYANSTGLHLAANGNSGNSGSKSLVMYVTSAYTPSEAARIAPNGNFGIGTPNPGYKLHVQGTTYSEADIGTAASVYSAQGYYVLDSAAAKVPQLKIDPTYNYDGRELGMFKLVGNVSADDEQIGSIALPSQCLGYIETILTAQEVGVAAAYCIRQMWMIQWDGTSFVATALNYQQEVTTGTWSGSAPTINIGSTSGPASLNIHIDNPSLLAIDYHVSVRHCLEPGYSGLGGGGY